MKIIHYLGNIHSIMLESLKNLGIKPHYALWEKFLTRKINFILVVAFINLTVFQIIFGFIMGFDSLKWLFLIAQVFIALSFIISNRIHYLWGIYTFFIIGIIMVMTMSALLGADSNMQLYYFPIVLNIIQLLGRKETRFHMYLLLLVLLAALVGLAILYSTQNMLLPISIDKLFYIKTFNLLMSSIVTLIFIVMITFQNQIQESQINAMLSEKDILMAEIFHRVKNNMNIITSLLNLKKHNAQSEETIRVLDDCRNRVFSMALVHQKLFHQHNLSEINFAEYARDLVKEISISYGTLGEQEIRFETDEIILNLDQAIPCGLILNEAITNAFKHAGQPGKKLLIQVRLTKLETSREIVVSDNGPGIPNDIHDNNSLGLELIQSLSEQLDGKLLVESSDAGTKISIRF